MNLSEKQLQKYAISLTSAADQIRLIERVIENMEYSRVKGDEFSVHFQVDSGVLGNINNVLSTLKDEIQNVSNAICPD
ncbi:hypothetical protein [Enterococcus sp. AZ196]|uniref:hypothetical protein n=1 Tax=Enterococcus sp. AZ196 TaxID=2774659 RepID=UPI003D28F5EC